MSDRAFYDLECVLVTGLVLVLGLLWLARSLQRSRPDLPLTLPLLAAFGLRVAAAGAVSLLPAAGALRGGDEDRFMELSRGLAESPIGSEPWTRAATQGFEEGGLHEWVIALQFKWLDSPEFALRVTQAGIAAIAIALMAAAAYELAGRRAGMLAAWVLALEPAGVFFSTLIHKEALLLAAGGLVAFGAARLWRRPAVTPLLAMAAGCLLALGTRPYIGWFLIAASLALALHASLRLRGVTPLQSLGLALAVVVIGVLAAPFVWERSSQQGLNVLQSSQSANATDTSNLRLERVEYSSRADLVTNLPRRVRDVMLRPYPWQTGNLSQQLGVLGSLFALGILVLAALAARRAGGQVMQRAGPLLYLGGAVLVAYALSVGNAGTGFRYRTHIVAFAVCTLAVLVDARRQESPAEAAPGAGWPVPAAPLGVGSK